MEEETKHRGRQSGWENASEEKEGAKEKAEP